jgi:lipopolysaccharide heptosyltransferase II
MEKTYRNILIIKPGAVGDLLQLTPAIRALKVKFPAARITVLVGSEASASLFRYNPHVHDTVVFDRRGEHRSLLDLVKIWQRLRAAGYDLIVNFQRSNIKAWFLASAAFPCRVLVYNKARGRIVHAVVNHLETLAPLGIAATADPCLELDPGADARQFAEEVFLKNGLEGHRVIALNPGASNRIKCWSPAQFAALGDLLAERLGARVIIVGSQGERDLAEAICSRASHAPLDLVGRTSLLELGAILERCDLLVSGDTGPLHMATSVNTPVIALFGAIEPRRTGPVGEGHVVVRHPEIACVPCNAKSCKNARYLECMEMITAEEVFQAVSDRLDKGKGLPCGC